MLYAKNEAGSGNQSLGQLCFKPFQAWKKAHDKFNKHESSNYHKQSILEYQLHYSIASNKTLPINLQLDTIKKKQRENNRKTIVPVIETIIVCGRQGIALRGHKDLEELIENDGNFRTFLRQYLKATFNVGNDSFLLARENCGRNAKYTSPQIQNEIVDSCFEIILSKIVYKINKNCYFSILADETSDVSEIEQFSLCARYYDLEDKKIHETFWKFVPVTDLSGRSLAQTIVDELKTLKIDLKYLKGQGYDGAASMSGKFNGVQACIRESYHSVIYIHCSAPNLNLSILYACSVASIRNAMGIVESIYAFLNTPKRQFEFTKHLNKFKEDNSCFSQKEKLKTLCPTQWTERHNSIDVFYDFQPAIISSFEEMILSSNIESSSKAAQLLSAIQTSEFNVSLVVNYKIFQYTKNLCTYLQKKKHRFISSIDLF